MDCEFSGSIVDCAVPGIACAATSFSLSVDEPKYNPFFFFQVKKRSLTRLICLASCVVAVTTPTEWLLAQTTNAVNQPADIVIQAWAGKVEVLREGGTRWDQAYTNQILYVGDRVRTRENSRVTLLFSDKSFVRVGPLSEFAIDLPVAPNKQAAFSLPRGLLYFFHRDKPAGIRINTRTAAAAINGTEFNLEATDSGVTILTTLDGEVELSNELGQTNVLSGEQGIAEPGKPPSKTAVINAVNVIQWALYYPAVLDLDELEPGQQEAQVLEQSLAAYRSGDLLQALAEYPAGRTPVSPAEKVYYGALLLAVGQVEQSERLFDSLPQNVGPETDSDSNLVLAGAIRQLIAAVKFQQWQLSRAPELATEWLAESYYQQSRANLPEALVAARKAVEKSPNFGFGWARVAELEFSFGRVSDAIEALDKSLQLTSRNAQALALKGFLLAAQNKIREAIGYFEQAITVDSSLGNAWLGRGLCRIRQGGSAAGRQDLLVAAALEPQRSLLRSYLGKAYADAGDQKRALKELDLAIKLDPNDPTPWLYQALVKQQHNQINEAVDDLEKSQDLFGNRQLYRSGLMLDQDRAVGAANLARIYADAGMRDVSVREAGVGVNYDYSSYSSHLFLANSYDQLRDPNRINLRYETPAVSEYLIANLLAPVGAGTLSPAISQQEYSKLFERDRLGLVSSTEYLSRGDRGGAWAENGAQYGTFGNTSYAVGAFYHTDPGQRPNNDLDELGLSLQFKQQLTPEDSVFLEAIYYNASGGDLTQYYDPTSANPGLRATERQEPTLLLGYNHEWNPGVHTLLLASWANDRVSVFNPYQVSYFVIKPFGGDPVYAEQIGVTENYHSTLELYSTELQQIWQQENHTLIVGGRFQLGNIHTQNVQSDPVGTPEIIASYFPLGTIADQDIHSDFQRWSVYGYYYWQIVPKLQLTVGLSYDWIRMPVNFRSAPVSDQEETNDGLSPKAGFIWTPGKNTTVRFGYTRSLAGASIDQSLALEPTQVAGFNQSFRSIIPESIGGAEAGAKFETYGLSLEQKLPTRTYLAVTGQLLQSQVNRTLGTFEYTGIAPPYLVEPSGTKDPLDYEEKTLLVTVNQLVGNEWSFGVGYRLTQANLNESFVELGTITDPSSVVGFALNHNLEAVLQQVSLQAIYNHPAGFFAQFQALWNWQSNEGNTPELPGDEFWQLNAFVGYRFPSNKAVLRVGVLNITDQDYRLNPLTLYNELPRQRSFTALLQFKF